MKGAVLAGGLATRLYPLTYATKLYCDLDVKRYNISLELIKHQYYKKNKSQDQIANELGVSQWVISDRMRRAGLQVLDRTRNLNPRKYDINHHAFDNLDEKTAWLIGWMLSDGFVNNDRRFGLKVAIKDKDIVEKLKSHIQYTGPIYKHKETLKQTRKTYHQVSLQATSRRIVDRFAKYGIVPNKSLSIKFPKIIVNENEHIIRLFIRGIFEGDGSFFLDKRNSLMFQIVGTYDLCYGIRRHLVKYIGVRPTKLTQNRYGSNHYALRYRGRLQGLKIMNWLYHKAESNVLKRKYNQYLLIEKELSCAEQY